MIQVVLVGFAVLAILSFVIAYFLYPVGIILVSKFCKKGVEERHTQDKYEPSISVLVVGKNEGKNISKKLKNIIESSYPLNKMEIIVISDGSTDDMVEKAINFKNSHPEANVKIVELKQNVGVNEAFFEGGKHAEHDILVFTDSNSFFHKDAIRKLIEKFAIKEVGMVNGFIQFTDPGVSSTVAEGYKSYWNIERMIKRAESKCGISCTVTGAISAMRKPLFKRVRSEFATDIYYPLWVRYKGYKTVYIDDAILFSPQRRKEKADFKRRMRVIVRGLHTFWFALRTIPVNSSTLAVYFSLFFHKILRWLSLSFLGYLLLLGIFIAPYGFGTASVTLIIISGVSVLWIFVVFSIFILKKSGVKNRLLSLIFYFNLLIGAATFAVVKIVQGYKVRTWEPDKG